MKNILLCSILCFINFCFIYAQKNKAEELIVKEGIRLYESEMASWYGSDIFMATCAEHKGNLGGYFSYTQNKQHRCVFFSKDDKPTVLATIVFDSTFDLNKAVVDKKIRKFNKYELALYKMRLNAIIEINSDTLFQTYENIRLNAIPIINGKDKKVYILSGTNLQNVVFFGNDYLITFDSNYTITSKKKLHLNIIPIEYGKTDSGSLGTAHTHLSETGDLITPTDICTLMLYKNLTHWQTHMVIGETSISIWNNESRSLAVIPKAIFEKINQEQSK